MLSAAAESFVRELEARDQSTAAHTWRVVLYARALAEDAGVDAALLDRITLGAAVHDIGKLDTPLEILQKPGPLTPEEFVVIQLHPVHGIRRLQKIGETDEIVLNLVRHHHERVDGLGYPDRLRGESIPLAARYFSVVDTFDALTSVRPYRMDVGHDAGVRAIAELRNGQGTRYCEHAVDRFAALFERGDLEWILHHFNDTCPVPAMQHLQHSGQVLHERHPGPANRGS